MLRWDLSWTDYNGNGDCYCNTGATGKTDARTGNRFIVCDFSPGKLRQILSRNIFVLKRM